MAPLLSIWWAWLALGLIFAMLEIILPGFIFLGFAIGAGIVGIALFGIISFLSPAAILFLFAIASLVAWLALRHFFGTSGKDVKTFDRDIND